MGHSDDIKTESRSIAKQIFATVKEKDLSGLAQQIAYNILFALAPLLIFITALAGWVTQIVNSDLQNPAEPVLTWMRDTLPKDAATFLEQPMNNALNTSPGFLLSFGAILALWGAKNAMTAIIKGLNVAYGVEDKERSWFANTMVAIGLTIGLGLMLAAGSMIFVLGTGIGDDFANAIGLGKAWSSVSTWLRWPLIAAVVILGVALIHRYGPNIDAPLKWYLPGAAFTVVSMLIATLLLGIYFSISGGYSQAYGTFGAVLAFIFWLYIMALVILIGGVINDAVQEKVPAAQADIEAMNNHDNDNDDHPTA
ncbi:MAG TPA: YihY/virulence factor BrkB family protein [Thermomicrobiales bacterium]|nr:YihY/virulence factor BrkB family protein [Thermomicrobiales bacterium]